MTLTMYDSIDVSQIPANPQAAAGYVDGAWPTFPELQRLFPSAHLLSIAVFASDDAECLDVETGDASIPQIYGWFTRQQARKVWRPCVYSSADNMDQIIATMTANGFARASYRLWSAHYGAGEHICGPSTCGLVSIDCDGTQWTDTALGRNLDQSVLLDDFFSGSPPPPPPSNWTEALIANLPTLQLTNPYTTDKPGWRFVSRLQALCTALGVPTTIDGVLGPATANSIRAIQRQFQITEDGICGRQTWSSLVAGQPG
jgi:peptidoglycan hydrolase-like protein with peptidoglycan-binding domain